MTGTLIFLSFLTWYRRLGTVNTIACLLYSIQSAQLVQSSTRITGQGCDIGPCHCVAATVPDGEDYRTVGVQIDFIGPRVGRAGAASRFVR